MQLKLINLMQYYSLPMHVVHCLTEKQLFGCISFIELTVHNLQLVFNHRYQLMTPEMKNVKALKYVSFNYQCLVQKY